MKQGDIVKLVKHSSDSLREASHSWDAFSSSMQIGDKDVPPLLTIKATGVTTFCGLMAPTLEFEELPGRYTARHFHLELSAGEPDVNELMKQVRELELVPA
jgi:hypothetical protein